MFALVTSVNGKNIKTAVVAHSELKIDEKTNKVKAMLGGCWVLVDVILRDGMTITSQF